VVAVFAQLQLDLKLADWKMTEEQGELTKWTAMWSENGEQYSAASSEGESRDYGGWLTM